MKNPLFRCVGALVAVFWLGSAVAGGHLGGGSAGGSGELRLMEKMGADLNLSENQKKDFAALLELYRPRFEEIARRGAADRKQLLILAPDAPDYTVLAEKVSAEAGRSAAETVTLLAELQGLVFALLTTEQQQTYLRLRAERRAKMQEHREKMKSGDYHHGKQCDCAGHADGSYCPHHDSTDTSSPAG
jgi:Spy/CpxP family protein refolding chaperone